MKQFRTLAKQVESDFPFNAETKGIRSSEKRANEKRHTYFCEPRMKTFFKRLSDAIKKVARQNCSNLVRVMMRGRQRIYYSQLGARIEERRALKSTGRYKYRKIPNYSGCTTGSHLLKFPPHPTFSYDRVCVNSVLLEVSYLFKSLHSLDCI